MTEKTLNRRHAGQELSTKLSEFKDMEEAIVLALLEGKHYLLVMRLLSLCTFRWMFSLFVNFAYPDRKNWLWEPLLVVAAK